MPLMIYNTLSHSKQAFEPIEPGKVRMYVCGVTVYDYCHLGHARSYIVWDTVRRYLQWRGFEVRYVQNFTDIDDKIIRRSQEEHQPWQAITQKYIDAYLEDLGRLNVKPADAYPKATEVVPQIIEFIQRLIEQGYAYAAQGDVYYAVERFPSYGKLSGRKLDQMAAGASGRVEEEGAVKKHHPLDFALWKAAKPGEPEWDSPWGKGRPGWHIECSAMVQELFGNGSGSGSDSGSGNGAGNRNSEQKTACIDIHTGGEDLVFPHHENEIAQSEAAIAQPLANYWLHNGFVKIRGDKMSKSLKNFTTIRALLETTNPMVVRLFVLQAHYRSPIDFTDEAIAAAENGWNTLKEALGAASQFGQLSGWSSNFTHALDQPTVDRFNAAMDDDFNTPVALSVLFELAKDLRRESNVFIHEGKTNTSVEHLQHQWQTLVSLSHVLGLDAQFDTAAESEVSQGLADAEIEALIQQRLEARKAKNFAEGDRIRDQLKEQGITLIDQAGGITRWHRD